MMWQITNTLKFQFWWRDWRRWWPAYHPTTSTDFGGYRISTFCIGPLQFMWLSSV